VFFDRPMLETAAAVLDDGPDLKPGAQVGPYRIDHLLGTGGMGQVYHATDKALQRRVALKFLPVHLATDANRLSRLRREAQLLAALNHPNIAQIYGSKNSKTLAASPWSWCVARRWRIVCGVDQCRSMKPFGLRKTSPRRWKQLTKRGSSIGI
jgi:hypothetical protein